MTHNYIHIYTIHTHTHIHRHRQTHKPAHTPHMQTQKCTCTQRSFKVVLSEFTEIKSVRWNFPDIWIAIIINIA